MSVRVSILFLYRVFLASLIGSRFREFERMFSSGFLLHALRRHALKSFSSE